ncbi:hypothetical protein DP116_28115 [Brasilonema bromeliae SPC951]|uniref:Uncharacterized protein n=1 Tax=Brasilonema bromeliae SPC951 TaxID=385972 RepID=A0ABX1PGT0_9CYAN|nr:hypothetical protein [Brasilonema bromeliae SPC951]
MYNNNKDDKKNISTDIWRSIDFQIVKHRIDKINAKLEAVLGKYNSQFRGDDLFHQNQDWKD